MLHGNSPPRPVRNKTRLPSIDEMRIPRQIQLPTPVHNTNALALQQTPRAKQHRPKLAIRRRVMQQITNAPARTKSRHRVDNITTLPSMNVKPLRQHSFHKAPEKKQTQGAYPLRPQNARRGRRGNSYSRRAVPPSPPHPLNPTGKARPLWCGGKRHLTSSPLSLHSSPAWPGSPLPSHAQR
jgi:hypothetical protein